MMDDASFRAKIERSAFESALDGIKDGVMSYKGDAVLPLIEAEMSEKL